MQPLPLFAAAALVGLAVGGSFFLILREDPAATEFDTHSDAGASGGPLLETDPNRRGLAGVEARLRRNPRRRQLAALALLYAADGDEAGLLRSLSAALRAGVSPNRVLDAIREFPLAGQGAILTAVLKRHPEVDFDAYRAAEIFETSGDPTQALVVLHDALPQQGGFDADLTRFLLHLDPTDGPAFLFGLKGAADWPGEDLQALMGFLIEFGQEREALPFIERALAAHPDDREALRVLSRLAPAAAADHMRAKLADNPNDVSTWTRLGNLLRKQGDARGAFTALEQAAALRPSRSAYEDLLRVDPARALPMIVAWTEGAKDDEALGLLARAYMKTGQRREAIASFLRAHESDPNDGEWIRGLIRLDPQQAVRTLQAQISGVPAAADEDLVGRYGDALRAAGRKSEAFDQYLAAHRKDPDDKDWQASMAKVDPERALPVLKAFLERDPDDSSGRGAYGLALAALGRTDEAGQQLERAIKYGDAEKWYDALAAFDGPRALTALQRRVRRDAKDDALWGALGRAFERAGQKEDARTAFRQALALNPSNSSWADALRR